MAQKAIREYDGKRMLFKFWEDNKSVEAWTEKKNNVVAQIAVESDTPFDFEAFAASAENAWIHQHRLVLKPDQLVKRRGELGLVKLNLTWEEAVKYLREAAHTEIEVQGVKDTLHTFVLEPFTPHEDHEEYYLSMQNVREGTLIYFYHQGGVHVGDVDSKAEKWVVPINGKCSKEEVKQHLLGGLPKKQPAAPEGTDSVIAAFIASLHKFYMSHSFAFLEVNPFVVLKGKVVVMDMAAKLDSAAHYMRGELWGAKFDFPPPFGKQSLPEEHYIASLDERTGASLKLTVLNAEGRIWTMVAGGGASVIYTDSIANLGGGKELANYGEYSGNPNYYLTYEYAKVIVTLMTRNPHPEGKLLLVGGGIANFTDVAETFRGIVGVFSDYAQQLKDGKVKILVRRGGPNYEEGLRAMKSLRDSHGLDIEVFGPETHITAIVPRGMKALKLVTTAVQDVDTSDPAALGVDVEAASLRYVQQEEAAEAENEYNLFSNTSVAMVYGIQPKAVQGMLDFDYACGRKKRSVCCMVYPFGENHFRKFYWGTRECLIPVYDSMAEAVSKHPDASVVVNFASFRSAHDSVMDAIRFAPQIKTVAIIAEGVPETETRSLIQQCNAKNVRIIGPATVGGIKAGAFKVGNTGGMLDNIIQSKLYRPGSVAYVSKSGGMSNELNNIISRNTDGVYEGVAIGGDRYPGTTFIDHLLRYEANPAIKILVLLGEVGGTDEYKVCELLRQGKIRKPLVAWCIGTCSDFLGVEVQFGHAGSNINDDREKSTVKNRALAEAGAFVPNDFDTIGATIRAVYTTMVGKGAIQPKEEPSVPKIPMDYAWAAKLGLVRKPTSFITTISDERGDELHYGDVPISKVFSDKMGVGGVIGLLWFQRELPAYATNFIEMILMLTADHGPAVSGAHNTIVTARAGKDLISSLCSGLLTIGPRFGGALDDAAITFRDAYDRQLSPMAFVKEMRANKQLIPGIGHRVKSVENPDVRVTIIKDYVRQNFPFETKLLNFALEVEKITTKKKNNLILNVDGVVAVCFVDLIRESGVWQKAEEDTYLSSGVLNALFVVGRSIGFVGHYLDQKRLKQPLYRHDWSDIHRINPEDLGKSTGGH